MLAVNSPLRLLAISGFLLHRSCLQLCSINASLQDLRVRDLHTCDSHCTKHIRLRTEGDKIKGSQQQVTYDAIICSPITQVFCTAYILMSGNLDNYRLQQR